MHCVIFFPNSWAQTTPLNRKPHPSISLVNSLTQSPEQSHVWPFTVYVDGSAPEVKFRYQLNESDEKRIDMLERYAWPFQYNCIDKSIGLSYDYNFNLSYEFLSSSVEDACSGCDHENQASDNVNF